MLSPSNPPIMFPPVEVADEFGVVCWGGEISPTTLTAAYHQGIFPWPHRGMPTLWFAPPQRALLYCDELHIGSRLKRYLRRAQFEIRFDTAFDEVIEACAQPRWSEGVWERGSWINNAIKRAYKQLHRRGHAHSVEAWQNGELVGGLYGVSWGDYFAGESMFYQRDGASKAALIGLVEHLQSRGVTWLDCEVMTPHFERMGAREVPRAQFMESLGFAIARPTRLFDFGNEAPDSSGR